MSKSPFPQALYDFYKRNNADTVFHTEGPSLTRQEFAEECDINTLMAKYDTHVIGGPGNLPPMQGMYVDWASMPKTLMEYTEFMDQAQSAFMSLPAIVRKEFDNDARMFVEFASDEENLEQMRTWGLAPSAPVRSQDPPATSPKGPEGAPPVASPEASTHDRT